MHILITSGGTIVKIDDVRHIGNFSSGSFPSKIASAALSRKHEVTYLHSKTAKTPHVNKKLKLVSFETYDEYSNELKNLLNTSKFDCVFLGAAVSDFGLKQHEGKISSNKSLELHLYPLPKVIKFVKEWSKTPLFQVGFKLLSNVSQEQLVDVAYKSLLENRSDLVIANDLAKIKAGKPEAILVTSEKGAIVLKEPNLASKIIEFMEKRANVTHFKTILKEDKEIVHKYSNEARLISRLCSRLSKKGLMTDYYKGAKMAHGSLALRVSANSFLITSRSSDKRNLPLEDVVLVQDVDWSKKSLTVLSTNGKKASFNAVLAASLFEKFKDIDAIVHTHSFAKNAPTTEFPFTPGTLEYATKPLPLFKKNTRVVNLVNHGLIALGEDLEETVNYVLR